MTYLFSWDDVIRKDYAELRFYLRRDLNIVWVENDDVNIVSSDKDKTICISNDKNSVTINIVEKKGIATLKIRESYPHGDRIKKFLDYISSWRINGETSKLTVKNENGKLKIYDLIIPKHSIVEIGGLKILHFELKDFIFVVPLGICLYIALAGKLGTSLSIIAASITLALMSFVKICRFNRRHKKVPEKIDMDNLHNEIIEFLDHCTSTNESKRKFSDRSLEDATYRSKRIKEELRNARELIDKVPPSPNPDATYMHEIETEKKAIYATWAIDPAMWRDPLFIHYVTIMGIKNLIECQNQNRGKTASFSRDPGEIRKFFREGIEIWLFGNLRGTYLPAKSSK